MILVALLFVSSGVQTQKPQNQASIVERGTGLVSFCDLFRNSERYNGATVQVSATYVQGFHEATVYDEECRETPSGHHFEAKFTSDSKTDLSALSKFLKKNKTKEAQLTIIAIFHDDLVSGVIRAGCCRYSLEVKQLVAVGKAAGEKTDSKSK
jgi:hypothetical protein